MNLCARCRKSTHPFSIASTICDFCVADRELSRRKSMGSHPDLEGSAPIKEADLQYLPSMVAAYKVARIWLVEFGFDPATLRPTFNYDPEAVAEIKEVRKADEADRLSVAVRDVAGRHGITEDEARDRPELLAEIERTLAADPRRGWGRYRGGLHG